MDGTTRSGEDRHRTATNGPLTRAHFHLLSNDPRRESGGSRADMQRHLPNPDPGLITGKPVLRELVAICRSNRIQLDMSRPACSGRWLADHVVRERLSLWRGDIRMRVARRTGAFASSAAFRILGPDGRWHLESLAMREPEDGAACDAVIRRGVRDAGTNGARRVFARLPANETVDAALRRSGFVPFTTESVLVLGEDARDEPVTVSSMVRRAHPADVWGIHQLYLEVVPRQVQYAEAMTSRAWERSRPLRPGSRRASAWVIEDHGRIRGYVRVSTEEDSRVIRLDLLIDPDMRALAPDLIAAAKSEVRNLHGVPCVATVPGYSHELCTPLQDAGFRRVGDQTAWVCYTTVPARSYIVAVDLGTTVPVRPQRARVPGFGGAGMSSVELDARSEGSSPFTSTD